MLASLEFRMNTTLEHFERTLEDQSMQPMPSILTNQNFQ